MNIYWLFDEMAAEIDFISTVLEKYWVTLMLLAATSWSPSDILGHWNLFSEAVIPTVAN